MRTVHTQKELAEAIEAGETQILAQGEIAEKLQKQRRHKKVALIGGAVLLIAGIAAIPFTGGGSAVLTATALTATIGGMSLTITAAELAILCGTAVSIYGLSKNRKLKLTYREDGAVEIDLS